MEERVHCAEYVCPDNVPYAVRSRLYLRTRARLTHFTEVPHKSFSAIESITRKTGNVKRFQVFTQMLESALLNRSDSVCVDVLTYEDLVRRGIVRGC